VSTAYERIQRLKRLRRGDDPLRCYLPRRLASWNRHCVRSRVDSRRGTKRTHYAAPVSSLIIDRMGTRTVVVARPTRRCQSLVTTLAMAQKQLLALCHHLGRVLANE